MHLVLSCEHGGREVPPAYRDLFASDEARAALDSHRGWDPGAADLAAALARDLGGGRRSASLPPLVIQRTTRLLIECNRSLGHPKHFSEFSRALPDEEKRRLVEDVWRPHRDAVRAAIDACPPGLVLHVGVHTFTPVWKGRRRATDVGLLYDPERRPEAALARAWADALRRHPGAAGLAVHLNRPYRGWTDGLTTTLRANLPDARYAGIELEVSQALVPSAARLEDALASTLRGVLAGGGRRGGLATGRPSPRPSDRRPSDPRAR